MTKFSSAKVKQENVSVKWDAIVFLALIGCIFLSGGVNSILLTVHRFANDPSYLILLDNWIIWIAGLSFLVGWLFAHGIEITFLQGKYGVIRILVIALLLVTVIFPYAMPWFVKSPISQLFDCVPSFAASGFLFRYSMNQKKTLQHLPIVLFEKKYKPPS